MAVAKTGSTYISACRPDSNEIPNGNTMFFGSGIHMVPLRTMSDVSGNRKSKMAVTSTGSTYISACRPDRNKIPKCKYHVFMVGHSNVAITHAVRRQRKWGYQKWPTSWDISTSGLSDRHLGFPISAYVRHCPQWHHMNARPKEHSISLWNFVAIWPTSWDISTSGWSDRHLGFPISAYFGHCLQWHHTNARPKEHSITNLPFGISLLSGLQAEI